MKENKSFIKDMDNINISAKAEEQYANAPVAETETKSASRDKVEEMVDNLFSKEATAANGHWISYFTNGKGANLELSGIGLTGYYDEYNGQSFEVTFSVHVYNNDFTKRVDTICWFDSEELNCTSLCKFLEEEHADETWEDTLCVPDDDNMRKVLMSINLEPLLSELEEYDSLDDCENWLDYEAYGMCGYYDLVNDERVA